MLSACGLHFCRLCPMPKQEKGAAVSLLASLLVVPPRTLRYACGSARQAPCCAAHHLGNRVAHAALPRPSGKSLRLLICWARGPGRALLEMAVAAAMSEQLVGENPRSRTEYPRRHLGRKQAKMANRLQAGRLGIDHQASASPASQVDGAHFLIVLRSRHR